MRDYCCGQFGEAENPDVTPAAGAKWISARDAPTRKRQQLAIGDEADPIRRIELGIRGSIAWFAEHREYFAIIQFAASDETFAPVLARNREISIADTIRHLKDGIVDGRIVDRDPELLAHAIHGVVAELTRHSLVDGKLAVDDVAELCVAFCLRGLTG